MLSIATVNVNGIRAAFRKGMGEWLAERAPDVVLMQETRAPEDIVASFFPEEAGWHLAVHPCEIKGRAGVAIASRLPVMASRVGLIQGDGSDEPPVDTGRWIEADLALGGGQAVTVVSTYFHSGTNTPEMQHTMDAKYAHLAKADARLVELVGRDHPVIVAGDFNIAHENRDITNWKGNLKSAGFLPEERAYLTKWFAQDGWVDLGRHHAGDVEGPYTWWSWRGQAFNKNSGWRIDYQAGNPAAARGLHSVAVDRPDTYEQRWSDHAPVFAQYNFS